MFITTAKVFKSICSVLYKCRKPVTWSKKLLRGHFIAIIISISAHAQTLNEYPDAENTFEYQNNERISEQSEYSLQPYIYMISTCSVFMTNNIF